MIEKPLNQMIFYLSSVKARLHIPIYFKKALHISLKFILLFCCQLYQLSVMFIELDMWI